MEEQNSVSRREFMGGIMVTGLAARLAGAKNDTKRDLIKPPKLQVGDTIGLVSPASPVFEPSEVKQGEKTLQKLGFRVKLGKHVGSKWGYLAGSDMERAQDLMDMFLDDAVRAIVALRGGYGTVRLLPYLDYDKIRKHPKILLGYSDITSLHLAIHKLAGIVTYHGPVALSTFNEYSTRYVMRTLTQTEAVGEIEDAPDAMPLTFPAQKQESVVAGPLVGGNLTLVSTTLGTPYEIDTAGKILFLEEVGEEPYSIDRMLTQLLQAGKLNRTKGIIVDRCAKCQPAEYKPAFNNTLSVEEIIQDRLGDLGVPVLYGLSLGHVADKPVLPLGITASVDFSRGKIAIVESAVA